MPIHEIAAAIGVIGAQAFSIFYALSGCDTISSVLGRVKKTFCEIWKLLLEMSEVFARHLTTKSPKKVSENDFEDLEEFFTLLSFVVTYNEIVNSALRVIKVVDNWKTLLPQQLH